MMDKNQSQQAGNNSQQMQITNCPITIINGIDEKRAREISVEVFDTLRRELTKEALNTAKERVQKLEDQLIPRMQKMDKALNAFSDPAFQFLLAEAQRTAAKTERPTDYELLSELLIRRIEKGNARKICAGINKAVEIVDTISDEALLGLTTSFFIIHYTPINGIISDGLDYFDKVLQLIIYDRLPTDSEWIDNLDVLGAVRISVVSTSRIRYEEYFSKNMNGYCCVGIKKESENYLKAIKMLNEINIRSSFLCDHELNQGYVRLAISKEKDIENLEFIPQNTIIGTPPINNITTSIKLNEKQIQILHKIFSMYENNNEIQKNIKKKLQTKLEAYKYINIARTWWNNLPIFYQITSVGKNLAFANAKRICPSIPPLK